MEAFSPTWTPSNITILNCVLLFVNIFYLQFDVSAKSLIVLFTYNVYFLPDTSFIMRHLFLWLFSWPALIFKQFFQSLNIFKSNWIKINAKLDYFLRYFFFWNQNRNKAVCYITASHFPKIYRSVTNKSTNRHLKFSALKRNCTCLKFVDTVL